MRDDHETVEFSVEEEVATVRLNRPERLNAWNPQLGEDLGNALKACDDDAVRCVVITGAGRAFSSGADLKAMMEEAAQGGTPPDITELLKTRYHPLLKKVRDLPKPVVAAVNGVAAGIGCSLALAADLVWAKESATFMLAFVRVGLVPDGGSTLFVPAGTGKARAFEMAMLGEQIPAESAAEWGLVNRVVPDDQFDEEIHSLAARLASGPTRAYAGAKQALNNSVYKNIDEQLDLEARLQGEAVTTEDFKEGVIAFVEKRDPAFSGK